MFYVVAVALLDGQVYPEQLTPERIRQSDVQALLRKIEVHTGFPLHKPLEVAGVLDPYTRAYPEKTMAHVAVDLSDGEKLEAEVSDYPGFHTNPLGWEEVIGKFRRLSEATASKGQQDQLIEIVQNLENTSPRSLIDILTS